LSEETSLTGFSVAAPFETSSDFFSPLAMTERSWFASSGVWFWMVIALGALLRFYLVFFTEGTQNVAIWERHARDVRDYGLIAYYHGDPSANHPPFITGLETFALRVADATGIPFRVLLRAPFALLDLGTTFLLLRLFGECRWRFIVAAVYWLNPLSIIFSAYHGNTDSAVAFFLALCVWLLSKNKLFAAAIALGVSLWIKLPIVLAIPAFGLFIPEWRRRFQFLAIAVVVALVTYLPALILDPAIIWKNVFGYRAQILHTTAGVPAWGPRVLFFSIIAAPQNWPVALRAPILFFLENSWLIALALALLITWFRREQRGPFQLCATVAMIYILVLALSDGFSFQYFAWSLPFWFFLPRWFFVPAIVLVSVYIYCLYAYLCANLWLLGFWDFNGHPNWPLSIIAVRNIAYLLFCACAIWIVIRQFRPPSVATG
jgi:Predicted integral membrane protein